MEHSLPADIERSSFAIIRQELREQGFVLRAEHEAVILRVIHATADFDYAENLLFTEDAVRRGIEALRDGAPIVTDTNMALAGLSKPGLRRLGAEAFCFMAEPFIAQAARKQGTTRAAASMRYAAEHVPTALYGIGNAPTALFALADAIENGLRPALMIAAPVGFVNVTEGKERIWSVCQRYGVPAIVARGRKGGSGVAAAIANALIYTATQQLDPTERGWAG